MTRHYFQIDKLEPRQEERLKTVFEELPASSSKQDVTGSRGGKSFRGTSARGHANGHLGRFTPAVVEQVASEHETIDDFISALEARR